MKKERAAAQTLRTPAPGSSSGNSSGTASVTLGILGILLPSLYGLVLGICALVFALVQHRSLPSRWSIAGIILGILSIIVGILGLLFAPVLSPELFGGGA